ncbi:parathymosin [Muntiacus reevesi]|uniref:parathymosin n=1 Tax=Muntiacus reevesi TaxID=9886 RepID=UPI003307A941
MPEERGNPARSGSSSRPLPPLSAFGFSNTCLAFPSAFPPPHPLAKSQGFLFLGGGVVARIQAIPPVRPQKPDSTFASNSSRLPHPWEAPPVGQRRFISGFPARGRPRLVGGSSAGAGAASRGPSDRGRSAPATARTALPPALRTAAALRVSAPDPPPPHPARLCRLFLSPSLPSGRRCRCRRRRRHRARFRPRPASAVQGPSVQAPGPRLPASPGPGPGTMSEKSVEAAAELSAKDLKEKKEKVEEKAGRKERKKEVVEEEENGAEEEEEETAEDGEEEDEGDEEDEEEEEDEDEGPALKRAAEEEDEADPKRQKTENGASA